MVYESSYDSGRKPYQPDLTRGYWAASSDFIYATIGLAFRLDIFSMTWFLFANMGFAALVPYVVCLFIIVVPIFVIQSFMGQFSSTGFISAFRMSPIFKGMGYISLALNLAILTYYSIFASVALLYLFNSLRPTLPWSCEGMHQWFSQHNQTDNEIHHFCNLTIIDTKIETTVSINDDVTNNTDFKYINLNVPSILYFNYHFNMRESDDYEFEEMDFFMSWQLILCTLFVWTIITGIFYKCFNTQKIGQLIRYGTWTVLVLLIICVLRFGVLHTNPKRLFEFFVPNLEDLAYGTPTVVVYILSAFGAGWGSIISLASFNHFRTNLMRISWIACLGQMGVFFAFGFLSNAIESFYDVTTDKYNELDNIYVYVKHSWVLYLSSGTVLATFEWPNFWCIIFYSMLFLAAIVTMVTSIFSLLQSVFDEFELLRARRMEVTFGVISFVAFCSFYTCSNHGVTYFPTLSMDSLFTQTALNLLLIFVALWIYGRERFQRDIEFMLSQRFSTWKVNMLRFVTPLCLILIMLLGFLVAIFQHSFAVVVIQIVAVFLIALPWLYIPGYMIFIMLQTTGSLKMRFKRCCRPMDWYPVELEERQRYEETMGNMDITHQLNQLENEMVA